jgi:DNA-binding beta-propeller fold protein YncE
MSVTKSRVSRPLAAGWIFFFCFLLSAFSAHAAFVRGRVSTGHKALGPGRVTLYQAGNSGGPANVLGKAEFGENGAFRIKYRPPNGNDAVLYLIAAIGSEIKLATVPGKASHRKHVVINEKSTVATAYAMAQFIAGDSISGKNPGLSNAAAMLKSLVDITDGRVSSVLKRSPNGMETTAWADFNTLSNMLARCVNNPSDCAQLFELSESPSDGLPTNTLQAMINIAHNPANNVRELLEYARKYPLYRPALKPQDPSPDAWVLALRFADREKVLDGPGLVVLDRFGNAWVNNNYKNAKNPKFVCGDNHVLAFGPDGRELRGSPFGGGRHDGGIYGSGWGICIDPNDDIWIGNFGFTGSKCYLNGTEKWAELSSSVSQFSDQGRAISPSTPRKTPPYGGWRSPEANIFRPQGTVSDTYGNIWLANCGNSTVTKLVNGSIDNAFNFVPMDQEGNPLLDRPFGAAIDPDNDFWIVSNHNHKVVELDQDGNVLTVLDSDDISLPMGIASDPSGNVWIANSGAVRPPCRGASDADRIPQEYLLAEDPIPGASVSVYLKETKELRTFTGGGIFMPWGIAVDGNNDIWVANFAGPRSGLIGIARLCGVDSATCSASQLGQSISPPTGYTSNGLERITGVSIDASGNVWLANNWKRDINLENPGGHQIVVLIGLAGPIRMPLIGPPQQP